MPFRMNTYRDFRFSTIPSFSETNLVHHGFTTRVGGVSAAPFDSMNLGLGRGDKKHAVLENYKIAGAAIGFAPERLVFFQQVHGSDIFVAHEEDAGLGFSDACANYDGIITNVKNLPIATFHADCTPIFLLDPIREVVGVVHAGWRGTASKTVSCAVEKMHMEFGCTPQDILAGIGPAAGLCCYETNEDVPHAMEQSFGTTAQKHMEACGEKWHVDMAGLNREALLGCGVLPQNITESGECTCCKDDIYWSHRKTDGIRGCMAAIIMLY